jgi:hypothetical protein
LRGDFGGGEMSKIELEECSLEEATHFEIHGVMHELNDNVQYSFNGTRFGIRLREDDVFIPENSFPLLGIKPFKEIKPEPIEFEFIPSIEMAKDMWLPADFIVPMEAVGKKFKCVEILEEEK